MHALRGRSLASLMGRGPAQGVAKGRRVPQAHGCGLDLGPSTFQREDVDAAYALMAYLWSCSAAPVLGRLQRAERVLLSRMPATRQRAGLAGISKCSAMGCQGLAAQERAQASLGWPGGKTKSLHLLQIQRALESVGRKCESHRLQPSTPPLRSKDQWRMPGPGRSTAACASGFPRVPHGLPRGARQVLGQGRRAQGLAMCQTLPTPSPVASPGLLSLAQ